MGKTQINFRIDEDLLKAIQDAADSQGISYTSWIINQCRISLGLKSEELSESRVAELIQQSLKPVTVEISYYDKNYSLIAINPEI